MPMRTWYNKAVFFAQGPLLLEENTLILTAVTFCAKNLKLINKIVV